MLTALSGQAQLVLDGGFEATSLGTLPTSSATGWFSPIGATIVNNTTHTGSHAAPVDRYRVSWPGLTLVSGQWFIFDFWAKTFTLGGKRH